MGIWIRSQDKKILANVITAGVDVGRNIFAFINNDKAEPIVIGTYSTEEKALKVLDMIEKKIIENNTIVCNEKDWAKYVGIRNCIFQMPDDEE